MSTLTSKRQEKEAAWDASFSCFLLLLQLDDVRLVGHGQTYPVGFIDGPYDISPRGRVIDVQIMFFPESHGYLIASTGIVFSPDHKAECSVMLLQKKVVNGFRTVLYFIVKLARPFDGGVIGKDSREIVHIVGSLTIALVVSMERIFLPRERFHHAEALIAGLVGSVAEDIHRRVLESLRELREIT